MPCHVGPTGHVAAGASDPPANRAGIIPWESQQARRFHTARVKSDGSIAVELGLTGSNREEPEASAEGGNVRRQLVDAELQWQPLIRQHRRKIREREHSVHAGVDTADRGMCVRAAHESRLERFRKFEIVDEAATAAKKRPIFEAQHSFCRWRGFASRRAPLL
jgi:hypothetical protein